MVLFSQLQPSFNKLDLAFGRLDAPLGLLLKGVQHVYGIDELHRVNRLVRIGLKVIHYLQDTGARETLQRFRGSGRQSPLCLVESEADLVLHLLREAPQVFQRGADPEERLVGYS